MRLTAVFYTSKGIIDRFLPKYRYIVRCHREKEQIFSEDFWRKKPRVRLTGVFYTSEGIIDRFLPKYRYIAGCDREKEPNF